MPHDPHGPIEPGEPTMGRPEGHDHGDHVHPHPHPRKSPLPHPDPFLPVAGPAPKSAAVAASGPEDEGPQTHAHAHESAHAAKAAARHEDKAGRPRYARVYVITCSDTRTEETDESGRILRARLADHGHVHSGSAIIPDEAPRILAELDRARQAGAQVVLISGGTGLSKRDATFEALRGLVARPLPGFGELFRMLSFEEIGAAAMLSRALAFVCADGLVVFAMPGSPAAVRLACDRLILPELLHLVGELSR